MAKKKRKAPSKTCPSCQTEVHARKNTCPECGHDFTGGGKTKRKKAKRKIAKRAARPARTKAKVPTASGVRTTIAAYKLIEQAGGADRAKALIDNVATASE